MNTTKYRPIIAGKSRKRYFADYYQAHKEIYKERSRRWYKEKGKTRYGLTKAERDEMLRGPCQICGNKAECIDHSHETNKVRGVLCHNCNRGLGLFKDDIQHLKIAIQYLATSNGTLTEG